MSRLCPSYLCAMSRRPGAAPALARRVALSGLALMHLLLHPAPAPAQAPGAKRKASPAAALSSAPSASPAALFNVRDYGAAGQKSANAQPAIQRAIDACGRAGGGTVYLPPGQYTSGTLHLRSHVRLLVDSGATLFASLDSKAFDKATLLYGEDLEDVTIEGRGTLDGQAAYDYSVTTFDDAYIRENALLMKALGKPLLRSFPRGFPNETVSPHMILLLRCKDVRIAGLSFLRSRSWTINPYGCERLVIDGIYIYTSLKDAVWADGIDPDGCRDVRISNSTIVTGDDAIVFYSTNMYGGRALPCENITVTNCRLSSASSAIKFCDGNMNCVRHVTIDNSVITDSNRGLAFMVFDGGYVADVVLSNLTIECNRKDWFWWGDGDPIHFNIKRRSEVDGTPRPNEPPAGAIRDVIIRNVIARGQGTSAINGHPDSWLENISIENVKLFLSNDPSSPLEKAEHAMKVRWARNLRFKDVEVHWSSPASAKWKSALSVEDTQDLDLDGIHARQAPASTAAAGAGPAAISLDRVDGAIIRSSRAMKGTGVFLDIKGEKTRAIYLYNNDLSEAGLALRRDSSVPAAEIQSIDNFQRRSE